MFKSNRFDFCGLLEILYYTHSCTKLIINNIAIEEEDNESIQNHKLFQYVSKTNKNTQNLISLNIRNTPNLSIAEVINQTR